MIYKTHCSLFTALLLIAAFSANAAAKINATSRRLCFIENKGQITDQYYNPRKDIQYALQVPGLNIFIGNAQIHYQFTKTTINYPGLPGRLQKDLAANKETDLSKPLSTVETYRMDVELIGADQNAEVIPADNQAYYENYYLTGHPKNGIQAHTCGKITYKNVYKNIDWVIYIKNNKLEHEFVVGPGGNAADIKLKYNGQSSLQINEDGSVTATTPMGTIVENAPVCYNPDGKIIEAEFHLRKNVLSYDAVQQQDLIIDPTLEWGTYYGPDSNNTSQYGAVCDTSGNIYSCGLTYSPTSGNVATTGSYQAIYGGGADAFLVKFDSSGNRVWGTYYGGSGGDWATAIALDQTGNVFITGNTGSTNGITTTGCQQATFGGGAWDGFLAKFTASGLLQWGTYAGGSGLDYPYTVACDAMGNAYIAGATESSNNITTPGSFMPVYTGAINDFLIQYNSAGAMQWGTYYGNGNALGGAAASDGNYIYLVGFTSSLTNIATPFTHQVALAGSNDAFIVKFAPTGTRQWGTYFGGSASETVGGVACDAFGGLYIFGATSSDTGIASPSCFQPLRSGGVDAFLVKMNPDLGTVLWSTYYGGPDNESTNLSKIVCDNLGDVYITGFTASTSGIASPFGAWQAVYGGGDADGFFAEYNNTGTQLWSSYYGGSGYDEGRSVAFDGKAVYLCGETASPNDIATPGSFLDTGGSGPFYYQGFLAKFLPSDSLPTLHTVTKQVHLENISIYPNPNNGSFTLNAAIPNENGSIQLSVMDWAGRTIMKDDAVVYNGILNKQIRLGNVPEGTYLLKVVTHDNVNILQFVKE